MQQKQISSIQEVDFSGLRVPFIAVYQSPEDFPGRYVARIFELDKPTDTVIVKKTLPELQEEIQAHTGKTFIPRESGDVPCLVGVWI